MQNTESLCEVVRALKWQLSSWVRIYRPLDTFSCRQNVWRVGSHRFKYSRSDYIVGDLHETSEMRYKNFLGKYLERPRLFCEINSWIENHWELAKRVLGYRTPAWRGKAGLTWEQARAQSADIVSSDYILANWLCYTRHLCSKCTILRRFFGSCQRKFQNNISTFWNLSSARDSSRKG